MFGRHRRASAIKRENCQHLRPFGLKEEHHISIFNILSLPLADSVLPLASDGREREILCLINPAPNADCGLLVTANAQANQLVLVLVLMLVQLVKLV